jgi:nucleotide-binding universal stress UspA family protein
MRILAAVDGSKCSIGAVRCLVRQADGYRGVPKVDLVNVHYPIPRIGRARAMVGKAEIARYYREESAAALAGAQKLLDAAGIPHVDHLLVGDPAESIVELAARRKSDLILLGTHGRTAVGDMLIGSVAAKVLRLSKVPVQLVRT